MSSSANELKPMSIEELESWVQAALTDAADYTDHTRSPHSAEAMRYWLGHPFSESGHSPKEEENRSQIVDRSLHDAVNQVLPALMRIFFGSSKAIAFTPRTLRDVEVAEQATDFVNYLFRDKNQGYRVLLDVLQDTLIKGTGVAQVFFDERTESQTRELSNVSAEAYQYIAQQGIWQIINAEQNEDGTFELDLSKEENTGEIVIESVPPEELLIDRYSVSEDETKLIARRQHLRVSDLIEMGYPLESFQDYIGPDQEYKSNEEWLLRHPTHQFHTEEDSDLANREVIYVEAYCRVDVLGTGRRQLRKICTAGNAYNIINNEPVDEHPFVLFRMQPLPHSVEGMSLYDEVGDLQRIRSALLRNQLDSLSLSVNPRFAYLEQAVDIDALENTSLNAMIPMRQLGAIQPIDIPNTASQVFPMLEYLDKIAEARTGISRASQGLEAEHLQSTTRAAVEMQRGAAEARLELIARNIAETGMRPLYEKILRLATFHGSPEEIYQIRGQYVPVDPTSWPKMSARVSLPLGGLDTQSKIATYQLILAEQEKVIQLLGVDNPLTSLQQWRETMLRMLELQGIHDGARLWNDPTEAMQAMAQQPPEEPEKTPEQMLAEAEVEKKRMDVIQRQVEMKRKDDRDRDQQEIDLFLKIRELELKHGIPIDPTPIYQMISRNRELSKISEAAEAQQFEQQLQPPQPPPAPPPPGVN